MLIIFTHIVKKQEKYGLSILKDSKMETNFILIIHSWKNGTLIREVEEFIFEEEAYLRIKTLKFFDSLKLTDRRGMVLHEHRNPVPPAHHHRHKHHHEDHYA